MKRNSRRIETAYLSESGSDGYMPHVGIRLKRKPSLRERLFDWIFRFEPDEQAAYTPEEVYYEAPVKKMPQAPLRSHQQAERQNTASSALEARQLTEIQLALSDWKAAAAYFESVSEPALVDYAVYEMEAAQKRYMYLLRSARNADGRRATNSQV